MPHRAIIRTSYLSIFFFMLVVFQPAYAQVNAESLVKSAWLKILTKYKKATGKISAFDSNGDLTEWPIVFQPTEEGEIKEIDNMDFHMQLPELEVDRLSTWVGMMKNTVAGDYTFSSLDKATFFWDDQRKEAFKTYFSSRFGSTKNIYCLSNEPKSPDEYIVAIFCVQSGKAKLIGFWTKEYGG